MRRYELKMENKIGIVFILLIIFQLTHAIEELLGNASFITTTYGGEYNFLLLSLILLLIPVALFYFTIRRNKKARSLSYIYGVLMIVNGLWHIFNTKTPGVYSSIGLIVFGSLLIYALKLEKKS